MPAKLHNLASIPKTPLADVQPIRLPPADDIFRVERGIPGFDVEIAEDDVGDVGRHWGGGRGGVGGAVGGGEDGGGGCCGSCRDGHDDDDDDEGSVCGTGRACCGSSAYILWKVWRLSAGDARCACKVALWAREDIYCGARHPQSWTCSRGFTLTHLNAWHILPFYKALSTWMRLEQFLQQNIPTINP